jgi:valyl-tRNA synthetase
MNNIKPWCISRQLWWGHQIPAWYGPDKKIFVALNEKEAILKAKKFYKKNVKLIRDPDVLDTWFSSGLWPFATLGWPKKKDYMNKFYPTSVLVTGFDIIFFWVARMIMFGMEFLNKEPFKDIYVHALVRDEKGQKMSKSKGNVIDPLELIEKYSADALRFTLLSMASPGRDVKLSEDRVKGYRNFLNKLWNANNFLKMNKCDFDKKSKIPKISININKWIYRELIDTKNLVEKNIKDYRFDEASRNAYKFVWNSYCDWYLELSKTIFYSKDKKAIKEVRAVSGYVFKQILILLHPFIPFITEEIWLKNKLDNSKKNFLMFANWPSVKLNKDKNLREVETIISIITEIRSFKNELNVSPGSFIDISIEKINKKNKKLFVNNNIVLKRLGRINNFLDKDKNIPSATLIIEGDMFKLYFDQSVDLNIIKDNLIKKQSKYQEDLNKISQRLSNKEFVDRAPKNIVDQEKTNYSNLKNDIKKISLTIKNL